MLTVQRQDMRLRRKRSAGTSADLSRASFSRNFCDNQLFSLQTNKIKTTMARRTKTLAEQLAELDNPAPKGMFQSLAIKNSKSLTNIRRL
jgi:hypothetical protein